MVVLREADRFLVSLPKQSSLPSYAGQMTIVLTIWFNEKKRTMTSLIHDIKAYVKTFVVVLISFAFSFIYMGDSQI